MSPELLETAPAKDLAPPPTGGVVGIGASAGGLEALEQLFAALPPDTGMAFIVVQHLSPDFRSLMDELISRHSEMPVVVAEDGMPVLPNRIHLMPPRKEMIIRDRRLVLTDKEPHTFTLPIDTFFRSLAQDVGEQAVAIVLSGSGSDDSRGDGATEPDGVVLTLTDMSALDKARSRLAQMSAIVESSEDAIVGKALDGTITSWNRGAEQLYGYTAEEAIGRNVRILMQPGEEHELDRFIARIQRGEPVEHIRSLRLRKDGAPVEVSMTISPILDRDGRVAGVSAIGRDISPLLAAQRELEARQHKIENLLAQAEESARRREQFIAMLSHELRNPLSAVMNATTLIQRSPDSATMRRCQAVIERQAQHMKRLLDDLLDVSRITRGKFELRTEDLDLRQPIEAAIESTAPLYAERGVRLDHRLPGTAMPVRGDANRLMQVVVNLLSNAASYSPRYSVVRLDMAIEAGAAVLRVVDHGVGIERELQEKIFELFVQSEQRLDRSRGGLGVGLSLARNIVELHGGSIEVHSDGPGRGSEFRVTIPLDARTAANAAAVREAERCERCRIVVVDDQEDSREMLRMLLESRDHLVYDASDGPSALALIERERPDIAFIDIGLPSMNGYEIAQQIRKHAHLDDVRLVALTGYGAPSDISAARAAGFDEHVIKPADLSRLEAILAHAKHVLD